MIRYVVQCHDYVCPFVPLYSDTVDVLFDDGVEYTAPFRAVRRRVRQYSH